MKLIDADKIKEELKLKELSHIIKQEEYLDYVLNEWKTRVVELGGYNVIEEIENAPTVEAIPIEWIKKFIDNDILSETVKILLNAWEWEKENEISVMPVSDNSTIPLDYLGEENE